MLSDESQELTPLEDGMYKISDGEGAFIGEVSGGVVGDDKIEWYTERGYEFEPVIVLEPGEYNALVAARQQDAERIAALEGQVVEWQQAVVDQDIEMDGLKARIVELEAQLEEARKWVPPINYQSGMVTYPPSVVAEWNTPEEDEAWKHLEDTDSD